MNESIKQLVLAIADDDTKDAINNGKKLTALQLAKLMRKNRVNYKSEINDFINDCFNGHQTV